ncbi:acetyltransferase (isoleucine patch superfamily)-like protein [Pseudonocardia dioxanivorans CB1190]|uniref:Acetyltransferase (Isoleucine patch superfamily)-like protein n=1 Tax=Pseudonocardia dioxanivorans (strain ATCC 55486 / DSM 44775 / JCM 13855 / CB1190) TaxID=675635 RepID=F4CKY3_PSEUX|nr:acyltransferase [Pseudonocardia dioxanivorans]AEA23976.1 acetyltransferase (isoleucine patch superfamily)-like protein [Pseudonocardia dioxanivorans CB1190]
MTSMWGAPVWRRWARRGGDDEQARFLTLASLRWVVRHRAWTPWYLVRYARLLRFRLANPHVVLRGMVFLGRRVELHARPGYGRLEIGRWVHIGDGNSIRCHEGSLRIGDKVVLGKDNTVNCYLDVEIGAATIVADWVYVTDFDHRTDDVHVPIKDQGIVKSPVRIGPDCWLGVKSTVLRGTRIGRGSVLGAHAVARGEIPAFSVAVGTPARVVRDRVADYEAAAAQRAALADIARKTEAAVREQLAQTPELSPPTEP